MKNSFVVLAALVLSMQVGLISANKVCPSFTEGAWAVGELRNYESATGEPSRMMDHYYESKTPRACCDACALVDGCAYWTWFQKDKASFLGDCALFRSFACDSDPTTGVHPLIPNKKARTGGNVCSRPETREASAPLSDKRDAAIAEMKASLVAQVAVRQAAADKWKTELDNAEAGLAHAEHEATKLEDELQAATQSLDLATAEVAKATAVQTAADTQLRKVQDALIKTRASVAQESAFAEKAREEFERNNHEVAAARRAKQSSDTLLAVEFAEDVQHQAEEKAAHPYTSCPASLEQGRWAVGQLLDLDGTKLSASLSDATAKDCCEACSKAKDCTYWSLSMATKKSVKGHCAFFNSKGCDKDSKGNDPFHRNSIGRVGKACTTA